jgi:hypothetical protein
MTKKNESKKKNIIELQKTTMDESVSVSITSCDESTESVFKRAKKQFDEMMK